MAQNNTPRQRPPDSSWFARNQPLLLSIVVLGLVAGAFAAGQRTSGDALPSATPTAEQDSAANATIPPAITRVSTSTARPEATIAPPTAVPSPTPIILTSAAVLGRIDRSEKLLTTKFHMTTLIRAQKQGSWFFDWGGQKVLVFVKGTVEAGVDLKQLKNVQVSEDERTIIITLPKAEILSATIDSQEFQTYDGQTPHNIATSLIQPVLDAGRQQIAQTACEDGIIERANADAKIALENLIGKFQLADYKVSILTSQEPGCSIDNILK